MDPISALSASASASSTSGASKTLGEHDFMTLLLTQLENQDPLNPLKGEELAAQLAQFASVQELKNINTRLDRSLQEDAFLSQSITNSLATGLLGKHVRFAGDTVTIDSGGEAEFMIESSASVSSARIRVYNEAGVLVRSFEMQNLPAGLSTVRWDGKSDAGVHQPPGSYRMEARVGDGSHASLGLFVGGTVDGIDYGPNGAFLTVGPSRFAIGSVVEVTNEPPAAREAAGGSNPLLAAARGIAGVFAKVIP